MAGDLLIVSIESEDLQLLESALNGSFTKKIHHADRNTREAWVSLENRLIPEPPNIRNRQGLPPHMYISFLQIVEETNIPKNKIPLLTNLMNKITRPLRIVSVKQKLDNWHNKDGAQRLTALIDATQDQQIIIEFYKVGGTHVLSKYPTATQENER